MLEGRLHKSSKYRPQQLLQARKRIDAL